MGKCPACGAELQSTSATAAKLHITDRTIRARLRRRRMVGMRLGYTWLVPRQEDQPASAGQSGNEVACPHCKERLFSTQQAAAELGVSPSRVYAILRHHPERLRAARVGRRWLIPASGIAAYADRRSTVDQLTGALTKDEIDPSKIAAALVPFGPAEASPPEGWEPKPTKEQEKEMVLQIRPGNCYCKAYPYPHRPGGGRCPHALDPVPKRR
jgi:excisionase family DNA binding protein